MMEMPKRYRGYWRGQITDTRRANPCNGEIVIEADGIKTVYFMAQGMKEGKLSLQCASDGFLVFHEATGDFNGSLLLYQDAEDKMQCVWRNGSQFSSKATMTRVEPETA